MNRLWQTLRRAYGDEIVGRCIHIPESFNGRTGGSGPSNRGSNPCSGAKDHPMWHSILYVLGLTNGNSPWYLLHSGIGATFNPVWGFGIFLAYKHKQCHVRGCIKLAAVTTNAGDHVCRKHHPDKPNKPSHTQVIDAHMKASQ